MWLSLNQMIWLRQHGGRESNDVIWDDNTPYVLMFNGMKKDWDRVNVPPPVYIPPRIYRPVWKDRF